VGDLDGALADFRASAALFARVDKNDNPAAAEPYPYP
jgi:hypothetical protein